MRFRAVARFMTWYARPPGHDRRFRAMDGHDISHSILSQNVYSGYDPLSGPLRLALEHVEGILRHHAPRVGELVSIPRHVVIGVRDEDRRRAGRNRTQPGKGVHTSDIMAIRSPTPLSGHP